MLMNDPFFPVRNIGKTLRNVDCNYKNFPKKNCVFGIHSKFRLFLPKTMLQKCRKNVMIFRFSQLKPTWWTAVCKGDTRFVSCWFTSARTLSLVAVVGVGCVKSKLRWEKLMEKIGVFKKNNPFEEKKKRRFRFCTGEKLAMLL